MGTNTQVIFHIHEDDGSITDIDAASISEARRNYSEVRGHFPKPDQMIEVRAAE